MFKKLKDKIGTTINTYQGEAEYYGTEVEINGRFNDSYSTNDGFFLIHEGEQHHIYLTNEYYRRF